MKSGETERDRRDGQYILTRLDRVCVCGHTLGEHSAAGTKAERPCFHEPCDCECFRKARTT